MAYCSERISARIKVSSFLAMLSVFVLHWSGASIYTKSQGLLAFDRVLRAAAEWAVPYFFVVSGFFFDRALSVESFNGVRFLRKKISSLFVPYLVWGAVWGGVVTTTLVLLNNAEKGLPMLSRTFMEGESYAVDKLLGIMVLHPVNTALWYVRALLLFFLLTPLWRWLRQRSRVALAVFAVAFIAIFSRVATFDVVEQVRLYPRIVFQFKVQSIGWLLLGMSISACQLEDRKISTGFFALLVIILIIQLSQVCVGIQNPLLGEIVGRTMPMTIIVVVWGLFQRVDAVIKNDVLRSLFDATFWAYCMHVPVCGWSKAIVRHVFGYTELAYCVDLTIGIATGFLLCWGSAAFVRRISPRAYSVLSGGR